MNAVKIAFALFALATVANASSLGFRRSSLGSSEEERSSNNNIRPYPENGVQGGPLDALHPSAWLHKVAQYVPSVDEVSFKNLVLLPVKSALTLLKTVYHSSYIHPDTVPLYTPNMDQVKMYLITGNGNVSIPLTNPNALKQYRQLNNGELTILVTGLQSDATNRSDDLAVFVDAHRERYQLSEGQNQNTNSWDASSNGNLIVIDLGNALNTFKKWLTVDIEYTGEAIGRALVAISKIVPYNRIHLIGHSVGAHVAGAAARYFAHVEDAQLPRVTGLDPSKVYSTEQQTQSELNRGVAKFVDVIHSTSYGIGADSNGDADFYPNGHGSVAASARNVFEASSISLRYYAESVRPGNENNFMAVKCNSMKDYENHRCHDERIPMGYLTPKGAAGDYILRVNSVAPYGREGRHIGNNRGNRVLYSSQSAYSVNSANSANSNYSDNE